MKLFGFLFCVLSLSVTPVGTGAAIAGEARIAVAANFAEPAKEIATLFEVASGHKLFLSFGASGKFYGQIVQGAPYDVLLSADAAVPIKAVKDGYGVVGTVFTYAIGRLALYSSKQDVVTGAETLNSAAIERIAVGNPATVPYGVAAIETMRALGVYDVLKTKLVQGQNIGQTFQFVETGNAEIGFVAISQIVRSQAGSRWIVPRELHGALRQDVVLLRSGMTNPAALAFLDFLRSDAARRVIERFGYTAAH